MKSEFAILDPPFNHRLTACVGFIQVEGKPSKYVIVKNKRGWDIPGGHLEAGESVLATFKRELYEESGCKLLPGAYIFAILQNKSNPKTGIAVYSARCLPGKFSPTFEIEDRRFVSKSELIDKYFGDKELLQKLLKMA